MKKILLLCAAALVIFGCGSKSNSPTPNKTDYKALVIGKWGNAKDTIYEYTNDKLTRTFIVNVPDDEYLEFKTNGTGNHQWDDLLTPFIYTITDKTIGYKTAVVVENGTTYPSKQYSEEIKTVNKTQLVTRYENVDIDQQGNVYKEIEFAHYTKLAN